MKKPCGGLHLCVDCWGLNNATIKNWYPSSLVGESLYWLSRAKQYMQLDITAAYHWMRIWKGDEWETAFYTQYEHYKYQVLHLRLANTPASFQAYVNRALAQLPEKSRKFKLHVCLDKCNYHITKARLLGMSFHPKVLACSRIRPIQFEVGPRRSLLTTFHNSLLSKFASPIHSEFHNRVNAPLVSMLKIMIWNCRFATLEIGFLRVRMLRIGMMWLGGEIMNFLSAKGKK